MNNIQPLHYISYSSLNQFHSCPRKFELDKMGEERPNLESIHFAFGHALGAGIQSLFDNGDISRAKFAAFCAWNMDLFEGHDPLTEGSAFRNKNTFPHVLEALDKFYGHYLVMSQEWELFYYLDAEGNSKPACELSARVDYPNGYVYRIYIDIVLRNKNTHELLVLELKSDGSKWKEPAKYANSNQALSYTVILDKIQPGGTSFIIWYAVYYKNLEEWEVYSFPKSRLQKANWIRTVLYDTGNIEQCRTAEFFPKQGESCLDWGRPCRYFGTCELSNQFAYTTESVLAERVAKEEAVEYTYRFTLEEIINQQLEDIEA